MSFVEPRSLSFESLKISEKEDVQEKLSWWFLKQKGSPSLDSGDRSLSVEERMGTTM